jgi:hypothetical protein
MNTCKKCGLAHDKDFPCDNVKEFEFYPDGTLKRIVYKTASDYAAPVVVPGGGIQKPGEGPYPDPYKPMPLIWYKTTCDTTPSQEIIG